MRGEIHANVWMPRRVARLAELIAPLVPESATALDIGCGTGELASAIGALRPDVSWVGADVVDRMEADIPYVELDGGPLPFDDREFDVALLVDVLHHADERQLLLDEAVRVANGVVVKDHFESGIASRTLLRAMDWVGNPGEVGTPSDYLSRDAWASMTAAYDERRVSDRLDLYPAPLRWLLDADLHFLSVVSTPDAPGGAPNSE